MGSDEQERQRGKYRIGSVSELTGIPPDTLRAWERRYGSVRPTRSDAGFRLYSEEDVDRLRLIKRLTECGNAIGCIAGLSRTELESRLARVQGARRWADAAEIFGSDPGGALPAILIDPGLAGQLSESKERPRACRPVESLERLDDLDAALDGNARERVVVVVDRALLGERSVEALEGLLVRDGVAGVVITYQFASRKLIRDLALRGARLVKKPLTLAALDLAVQDAAYAGGWAARRRGVQGTQTPDGSRSVAGNGSQPPTRRFTDEQLGRLLEVEGVVDCECPNHLSQIVSALLAFEVYSAECATEANPDGTLHERLSRETAEARRIMERALQFLVQADGIEL